jgi:hypothetical protein
MPAPPLKRRQLPRSPRSNRLSADSTNPRLAQRRTPGIFLLKPGAPRMGQAAWSASRKVPPGRRRYKRTLSPVKEVSKGKLRRSCYNKVSPGRRRYPQHARTAHAGDFFAEVSGVVSGSGNSANRKMPPGRRRYKKNPVARRAIGPPERSFSVAQDDSKRRYQLSADRGLLQNAVSYGLELVGRE